MDNKNTKAHSEYFTKLLDKFLVTYDFTDPKYRPSDDVVDYCPKGTLLLRDALVEFEEKELTLDMLSEIYATAPGFEREAIRLTQQAGQNLVDAMLNVLRYKLQESAEEVIEGSILDEDEPKPTPIDRVEVTVSLTLKDWDILYKGAQRNKMTVSTFAASVLTEATE